MMIQVRDVTLGQNVKISGHDGAPVYKVKHIISHPGDKHLVFEVKNNYGYKTRIKRHWSDLILTA